MIRITRGGRMDRYMDHVQRRTANLAAAEHQAVSGLKVSRPSDAPSTVRDMHGAAAFARDQTTWLDNASHADALLSTMDESLGRAQDIVVRLRQIAVQMASDYHTVESRAAAAVEVRSLQISMRDVANAQFAGRYVFAGTAYDSAAFDQSGVYQGESAEPNAQIGESRYARTGLDGEQVFQGSVDVFATIETLAAALEAGDADTTRASITDLEAATGQLSQWRSVVGSEQAANEDAVSVAESLETLFTERLQTIVQADPVEAYSQLGEMQNAYSQTLQVIASTRTQDLFDMLG
jgi:flagellar hook-associated protein 3 FlgL